MTTTGQRHIVNLTHSGAQKRIYLLWDGPGSGEAELARALKEIEDVAGPDSKSAIEFFRRANMSFTSAGLSPFKG